MKFWLFQAIVPSGPEPKQDVDHQRQGSQGVQRIAKWSGKPFAEIVIVVRKNGAEHLSAQCPIGPESRSGARIPQFPTESPRWR
jgi:hypothetical protein